MRRKRQRILNVALHIVAVASTVLLVQVVILAMVLPPSYGRIAIYYKDESLRQARGLEEDFVLRDLLPQGPDPYITRFELRSRNLNLVVGSGRGSVRWAFTTKYSVLFLAFGLFPVWLYGRLLERRVKKQFGRWRRRQTGLCPHCGYDLRATPTRCPECGAQPQPPHNPPMQRTATASSGALE